MTTKEKLAKYIKEGRYTTRAKATKDLKCSTTKVWYLLLELEAEGRISKQSLYKYNH